MENPGGLQGDGVGAGPVPLRTGSFPLCVVPAVSLVPATECVQ